MDMPYFTLFIPSYNRSDSLNRTLRSVEESFSKDLEVIVIDDGSSDNTAEVVNEWIQKASFRIEYIFQKNRGKMGAHNTALEHARGLLFLTLDAGDLLLPEGLGEIKEHWQRTQPDKNGKTVGIGTLCIREDGNVAGRQYPEGGTVANYLEMLEYTGEKRHAILTTVMKEYPYPAIPGEKHIRPDLILKRMAHRYNLLFLNIPVQVNVREEDGITANIRKFRMRNPRSFRLYFLEEIILHKEYYSLGKQFSDYWRYVRFSLHAGIGPIHQSREVPNLLFWLLSFPHGSIKWMIDKARLISPDTTVN